MKASRRFQRIVASSLCAVLLSSAAARASSPPLFAEAVEASQGPDASGADRLQWQRRYTSARNTRTTLFVLGGMGVAAGYAVYFSGIAENQDVEDIPGCSVSGSTVSCNSAQSTQAAQEKLDSSLQKIGLGALIGLVVGGGLLTWGAVSTGRISRLRKEGRNKGFISFGPDPRDPKRLQLAYTRRF